MSTDDSDEGELLTLHDAARVCKISRARLQSLARQGRIDERYLDGGDLPFFAREDVDALAAEIAEERVDRARSAADAARPAGPSERQADIRQQAALRRASGINGGRGLDDLERELRERRVRQREERQKADLATVALATGVTAWLAWQLKQREGK